MRCPMVLYGIALFRFAELAETVSTQLERYKSERDEFLRKRVCCVSFPLEPVVSLGTLWFQASQSSLPAAS